MAVAKFYPIIAKTLGVNNRVLPSRLAYDIETGEVDLAEAVNCDIDDSRQITRRLGSSQISSVISHSAFCNKGDCFFVQDRTSDAAIYRLGDDFISYAGVRSGLTKGNRVAFCQVGDKTYYTNQVQTGVITDGVSAAWPDQSAHVGAATTREFYPAPAGKHLEYWMGRMWISVGSVIYASEPFAVGKYAMARCFFQFGANVVMMKAVEGGMWVSTAEEIGFISRADDFKSLQWVGKDSRKPAHEWSVCHELVDLSKTALQIPGESAVWSSDDGVCVGKENGQLEVITEERLLYPASAEGATVVSDGKLFNSIW